jgi:hypothetical protein
LGRFLSIKAVATAFKGLYKSPGMTSKTR